MMDELKQYLLPCPLHEGQFARDCCKYTTDNNLPNIPCNVLVDFIGCRNCQFLLVKLEHLKLIYRMLKIRMTLCRILLMILKVSV